MKSLYSDNPNLVGNQMTAGADTGTLGNPTRTAGTTKNWYFHAIRKAAAEADGWRPMGYEDDGTNRVFSVGGQAGDAFACDQFKLYVAATYGSPAARLMLQVDGQFFRFSPFNNQAAAVQWFFKLPDKIGANLTGDSWIWDLGCPTGNADGGLWAIYGYRDGGSSGSAARTASRFLNLELTKNGDMFHEPGTAGKRVTSAGVLKQRGALDAANSGTGETDLASCTLTSGLLAATDDCLEFEGIVTFAANGNAKTLNIKLGATTVATVTANFNAKAVKFRTLVYRTGSSAQRCETTFAGDPSLITDPAQYTSAGETLSGSPILKITGTGGASNDIVLRNARWHFKKANPFNNSL